MKAILASTAKAAAKYKAKTDQVRWSATTPEGKELNPKWGITNCYANVLQPLEPGLLEIRCLPYGGPSPAQLPAWWYHYFFRLLKQVGLVPPPVKVMHRNGANCLIIPPSQWDRHSIYITLCYYRQVDTHPEEVMQALLLYQQLAPQGTSFLQCLHWLAAITKIPIGHYFLNFGTGPYACNPSPNKDLAGGLTLAWFAKQSLEKRLELCPPKEKGSRYLSRSTDAFLAKQASLFPSVKLQDMSELLDPKYGPLYENPEMKPAVAKVVVATPPPPKVDYADIHHEFEGE